VGGGIIGADERTTFVRHRRDVTANDNTRCIAAKILAGIEVGLERTLIRRERVGKGCAKASHTSGRTLCPDRVVMKTKLQELGEPLRDQGATSPRPYRHHVNREASCSVGSRPSGVR
jgi:hypothetical protein